MLVPTIFFAKLRIDFKFFADSLGSLWVYLKTQTWASVLLNFINSPNK